MQTYTMLLEMLESQKNLAVKLLDAAMDTDADDLRQAYLRMLQDQLMMTREIRNVLTERGWNPRHPIQSGRLQEVVQWGHELATLGFPEA